MSRQLELMRVREGAGRAPRWFVVVYYEGTRESHRRLYTDEGKALREKGDWERSGVKRQARMGELPAPNGGA